MKHAFFQKQGHRQSHKRKHKFSHSQSHARRIAAFFQKDTHSVIEKIEKESEENPLFIIENFFEWKEKISALGGFYSIETPENRTFLKQTYNPTWHDIFVGQVNLMKFTLEEKIIALSIIKLVDKKTGLISDPNWLYSVQNECNANKGLIQSIQKYLTRELDPTGMCSTSVTECIKVQIEEKLSHTNDDEEIEYLKSIKQKTHDLSEVIDCFDGQIDDKTSEEIFSYFSDLRSTIRFPYYNEEDNENSVIYPSARIVARVVSDGGIIYLESLEKKILPKYKISTKYDQIINDSNSSSQDKKWAIDNKSRAIELMNLAIERADSIDLICEYVFKKQHSFFETGNKAQIIPISQKELAKVINRDRSTVSRLIKDKYIDTFSGVIPLKYLIAASGNIAKEEIVKRAIQNEDKINPLTDKQISRIVQDQIGKKFSDKSAKKLRGKLNIPGRPTRRRNYNNEI